LSSASYRTRAPHLFNLANVAYFKHVLLNYKLPPDDQLKYLNWIAIDVIYGPVTAEAIAVIEPSCATGVQMLNELHKAERSQQMRAFEDGNVFQLLARLSPSLLRALELCYPLHKPKNQTVSA
jgi:hypothetical protein